MRVAALAVVFAGLSATASAQESLTVCLEENVPPLSMKRGKQGTGFDLEVARRVAALMGRYGPAIRDLLDRHLGVIAAALVAVVVAGFAAVKLIY